MDILAQYLVGAIAIIGLSGVSAYNFRTKTFSGDIFLAGIAISIAVLAWMGMISYYLIIVSILIIVGMLFMKKSGGDSNE